MKKEVSLEPIDEEKRPYTERVIIIWNTRQMLPFKNLK